VDAAEHDPRDALTAMLLQITQHAERLAALDEREAAHTANGATVRARATVRSGRRVLIDHQLRQADRVGLLARRRPVLAE